MNIKIFKIVEQYDDTEQTKTLKEISDLLENGWAISYSSVIHNATYLSTTHHFHLIHKSVLTKNY